MSESILKLREKTVVIYGPVKPVVQSLASLFVENGSDVALIDKSASESFRFINNLMDMRQVHAHYGRSAHIDFDIQEQAHAKEAISRAAELFGGLDVIIDANFAERDLSTDGKNTSKWLTEEALEFFVSRNRGRIVYLTYDNQLLAHANEPELVATNEKLFSYAQSKAEEVIDKNITINMVSVGPTDEYLLRVEPKESIKVTLEKLQKDFKTARVTDPIDIAHLVTFLASPLSNSITAQLFRCGI